jgi:hypothetical protein
MACVEAVRIHAARPAAPLALRPCQGHLSPFASEPHPFGQPDGILDVVDLTGQLRVDGSITVTGRPQEESAAVGSQAPVFICPDLLCFNGAIGGLNVNADALVR